MTITVDINVLLDVVQKREPHYAASARVVSLVTSGQLTGVFPSHALTTLYYLARKHASAARLDQQGYRTARHAGWPATEATKLNPNGTPRAAGR